MLKKILLASIFVITATTGVTYAEDDMKTVASKAYVDTKIETKQLKIPAAGQPNVDAGETVMTYTATGNGQIGERGLYSDISSYDATTDGDKLITASALNATFTNLPTTPTTKLECANQADGCTLWTIVDQTAYAYKLPDGYTRLEYIESTGTQYIDTGYIPTTDLSKIEFKFNVSTDNTTIFGVSNSSTSRVQMWYYQDRYSSRTFTMTPGNISSVVLSLNIDITGNLDATNGKLTINGNSGISTDIDYKTNYSYPMYVFALNNAGATPTIISSGKVYYLKVYENNALVRDFVPAKNSSGVIGMYDTVSGQFFTNAATSGDDFTPGPPAN